MVIRHQHGPRWGPKLEASAWSLVVTGITDLIPSTLSLFRTLDQDLTLGYSPDLDITLDSGCKQAIHISLFLSHLRYTSFPQTMTSSLSSTSPHCTVIVHTLTIMVLYCPALEEVGSSWLAHTCCCSFLTLPRLETPRLCLVESCSLQVHGMAGSCCLKTTFLLYLCSISQGNGTAQEH